MAGQPSLEDKIQQAGSALKMLRESTLGPPLLPAIPAEFTNWRPAVEDHEMTEIRATIMPVPYFEKVIRRD